VRQTGPDAKRFGLADKVWHGARVHLAHHLSTVNLDRQVTRLKRSQAGLLRPKSGDCCVYCSYGTNRCPPMQQSGTCCA
jgi:hypothetical protein